MPIMPNGVPLVFQFTPLREGRLCNFTRQCAVRHFNSRPCVRGDITHTLCFFQKFKFQFTPLREGRQKRPPAAAGVQANFNSRPCVRGDTDSETSDCGTAYFNSRPCVRGDALKWQQLKLKPYFNSRPCVRGDCCFFFRCPCRLLFQFTPLREGRRFLRRKTCTVLCNFNSRPCVRGDACCPRHPPQRGTISIHAPA